MRIRFLADEDLKFQIVVAVRQLEPTIDFMSANEAGLAGIKDPQVLLRASQEGRMLVTHDRHTMPRHFHSFIKHHQSPGIVVIPQSARISVAANDLVLIWAASKPGDWANQIVWIPV